MGKILHLILFEIVPKSLLICVWGRIPGDAQNMSAKLEGDTHFTRDLGTQITVLLAHLLSTLNIPFACKPAQLAGTWYHDARISVTEN